MNRSLALVFLPVAALALVAHFVGWYGYALITGRWDRAAKAITATVAKLQAAATK